MRRSAALVLLAIAASSCGQAAALPPNPALVLKACTLEGDLPAECGIVSVPEDRTTPNGRKIGVHVAVLRGLTKGNAVFLLGGGPGQPSSNASAVASGWHGALRGSLDFVLVDQRGTEPSNPLVCPKDVESDPAGTFGHVLYLDVLQSCRKAFEGRIDSTKYTTEEAVADLEDVRAQLGYEQITLFGVSYGTRLAQAYIRRHPTRVRAAILDGVAPIDVNLPLTMAKSLQSALDRIVYSDSRASAALTSLLERLDRGPIDASVRTTDRRVVPVRMSRLDFLYAVRGMLYQANASETLPGLLVAAARSGSVDLFAQRYWQRARRMQAGLAHGVHLSVFCAEDVPFADAGDIERETAGTVLGRLLYDEYAAGCRMWPVTPVTQEWKAPATANVPVLLISGRLDPVTPPEFGDRVARSLPRSRHIVVADGAHGSAAGCPAAAVTHVLTNGTLDGIPEVCAGRVAAADHRSPGEGG